MAIAEIGRSDLYDLLMGQNRRITEIFNRFGHVILPKWEITASLLPGADGQTGLNARFTRRILVGDGTDYEDVMGRLGEFVDRKVINPVFPGCLVRAGHQEEDLMHPALMIQQALPEEGVFTTDTLAGLMKVDDMMENLRIVGRPPQTFDGALRDMLSRSVELAPAQG